MYSMGYIQASIMAQEITTKCPIPYDTTPWAAMVPHSSPLTKSALDTSGLV